MKCIKCKLDLPETDFHKSRLLTQYYVCKKCIKEYNREYKRTHKEQTREYNRKYKLRKRAEKTQQLIAVEYPLKFCIRCKKTKEFYPSRKNDTSRNYCKDCEQEFMRRNRNKKTYFNEAKEGLNNE